MTDQISMFSTHWQQLRDKTFTFYATIERDGQTYFLWKPHSEYDECVLLSEKGRKLPFRWKTKKGASQYMAKAYKTLKWNIHVFDYEVWKNGT